jgi:hypothetical protein
MSKKPTLKELLNYVSNHLRENGIDHALIGGLAVALHGYPRATVDVDLLVRDEDRVELVEVLTAAGFICDEVNDEMAHFSGLGTVDCLFAHRETSLKMLANAKPIDQSGIDIVEVEDIIGLKIQAYVNDPSRQWKDQADIAELLRSNPQLDRQRILGYAAMFDQKAELKQMLEAVLG